MKRLPRAAAPGRDPDVEAILARLAWLYRVEPERGGAVRIICAPRWLPDVFLELAITDALRALRAHGVQCRRLPRGHEIRVTIRRGPEYSSER